jgi:nicotinamidase-related amidase
MATAQRFTANASGLLVIDVQGKLLDRIDRRDEVLRNIVTTIKAAHILEIPVLATEQYPSGLGASVPEVAALIERRPAKTCFHCLGSHEILGEIDGRGLRALTLVGIEAHVCVAQTALELLTMGFRVQVLADAVSSRHPLDRDVALRRLELAGAVVSTTEAALFEWTESADHPHFKAISALVKDADLARSLPK